MCEYALTGYGKSNPMEFEEKEEVQERERKRLVKVYKEQKEAEKDA